MEAISNVLIVYKETAHYNNYRRDNVVKYFSNRPNVTIVEITGTFELTEHFDTVFFEGCSKDAEAIVNATTPSRVVYDRTDNWSANDILLEDWLLHNADTIINTSLYLYEDSKKYCDDCYYVPSATSDQKYRHSNIEKTVVYAGFSNRKIDSKALSTLIDNNPGWHFISYGCDLHSLDKRVFNRPKANYGTCLYETGKAKVGLILLNDSEWAKGMLCLKTFDYVKAGLAIVTNSKNIEDDVPNVIRYTDTLKLDDIDFSKMTDVVPDKYRYRNTLKQIEEILND